MPGMRIALIDIGGTNTRFAVTNEKDGTGLLTSVEVVSTSYAYDIFLQLVDEQRQRIGAIDRVGVSFGVGLVNGVVHGASKMNDFIGRNIASDIEQIFKAPVTVHHDCVCAVAAISSEIQEGESYGYVTVSTGVGAAVVTNLGSALFFERLRLAHHVIDQHSEDRCSCGRKGCMAILIDGSRWQQKGTPLDTITDKCFWDQYVTSLATGLANFCRMFSLRKLSIGGGVLSNDAVNRKLVQSVLDNLPDDGYPRSVINIVPGEQMAPLRGACKLAFTESAFYKEF